MSEGVDAAVRYWLMLRAKTRALDREHSIRADNLKIASQRLTDAWAHENRALEALEAALKAVGQLSNEIVEPKPEPK